MDKVQKAYDHLSDAFSAILSAKYQEGFLQEFPQLYSIIEKAGDQVLSAMIDVKHQLIVEAEKGQ